MFRKIHVHLLFGLLTALPVTALSLHAADDAPPKLKLNGKERQQRDDSLRAVAKQIGIGPGCVIADIGAGDGQDSWLFADIVTGAGKVLSEEIEEAKTKAIEKEAAARKLTQVTAVLGKPEDPGLPANSVDMAFMHLVYHHLSQPREMLQAIWKSLKPGGKFVVIDQRLGTLMDWVPRADRAKKHFWIAETTVVREAREQGFAFLECAEQCWYEKKAFVLVFQRPEGVESPDRDPDAMCSIPASVVEQLLPIAGDKDKYGHAAFIALGEGRSLIQPILKATGAEGVDIVLEEWATRKDERPPLAAGLNLPSKLTDQGDPGLGNESIDAVYFLDSYDLLFHGPALLAKLNERLATNGRVYVLDRPAMREVSRREASHLRMIAPDTVKQEMAKAGFKLVRECPLPDCGRFLLVFGREGSPNP
jgi:predicted methyltransferase